MLKKGQIRKKWAAGLLTAALAISAVALGMGGLKAAADTDVDTETMCSLSIQMPSEVSGNINESSVTVKLYQVAEINGSYDFKLTDDFSDVDLSGLSVQIGDPYPDGSIWDKVAKEAAGKVTSETTTAKDITLNKQGSVYEAKGESIGVGLYLMVVDEIYSTDKTEKYVFSPSLIPLPLGRIDESKTIVDYEYDINMALKYDKEELYGNLLITKTLTSANSDYLPVSFVFQVTAVKDGETIYDTPVSIKFDSYGEKKLIMENIPAGAEVTVKEVYEGASYKLDTTTNPQTVSIVASELVEKGKTDTAYSGYTTAKVSFSNSYNNGTTGGHGVTNHYTYENGEWTVNKVDDNTGDVTNEVVKVDSSVTVSGNEQTTEQDETNQGETNQEGTN